MKKKIIGLFKIVSLICMSMFLFTNRGIINATTQVRAEGYTISKTSGIHEKWVDRIDFTNAQYALDFYDWLVENTDNDGVEDVLIDVSEEEHLIYSTVITFDVPTEGDIETLVKNEAARLAEATFDEVADYSGMAFAAFNRDYNHVFWLRKELRTNSVYTLTYSTRTGEAKLTQNISMIIKESDTEDESNNYDVRLNVYVDGTLNLKEEINRVNGAIDEVLRGVDENASRYEKVEHFNNFLTKNNCYAKTVTENSRDCRGALLGQKGDSKYAPVCEGYARAFKVLCDRAKIPCVLSSGLGGGESHMWNLVQLENGGWYGVDVTWNDPTSSTNSVLSGHENADYLLVGRNTFINGQKFSETHQEINKMYDDDIALDNGPVLTANDFKAPVLEAEWNVSKSSGDAVIAMLYRAEGYSEYSPKYKMVVTGNGAMETYASTYYCPWSSYIEEIVEIEIRANVTEILGYAFYDCTSLNTITVYGNLNFDTKTFYSGYYDIDFKAHAGYSYFNNNLTAYYNRISLCEIENWEIVTEQSCEDDEVLQGECLICGHDETKVEAYAYGHNYSDWIVDTKPTKTSEGEVRRVCANDESHVEIATIPALNEDNYFYSIEELPSCEDDGYATYTRSVNGSDVVVEEVLKATGHNYGEPQYYWGEDNDYCYAVMVCLNNPNHEIREEGTITTDVKLTCDYEGEVIYTAKFGNRQFNQQVKEGYHASRPHDFSSQLSYDDTSHWYACYNCDAKKDKEKHNYGKKVVNNEPSIFFEGSQTRTCEDCYYILRENIPKKKLFKSLIDGDISDVDKLMFIGILGVFGPVLLVIILKLIKRRR
ncbi:MAG: hypothetical protein IKA99_04395 [Clostridia bacterium]|nr:hypothetical protein [Clostridia bacterium]